MSKKSWFEEFSERCQKNGFYVSTYSPGDGITRYRFFTKKSSYFGPENGDYTALGKKEAIAYATGRFHGTPKI